MKIIDLLNKIANGEEVPKKIRITDIYNGITIHYNFFYDEDDQEYKDDELFPLGARLILDRVLNKRVEILEEEKKIPEKLKIEQDTSSNYYIRNENGTKCYLTTHSKIIVETLNQVIDYLKSKGDE